MKITNIFPRKSQKKHFFTCLLIALLLPLGLLAKSPSDRALSAVESKYHLKPVSGIAAQKVKHFSTLKEMDTYLKAHHRDLRTFTVKGHIQALYDYSGAPYDAAYVENDDNGTFSTSIVFPDLTGFGVSDHNELNISWTYNTSTWAATTNMSSTYYPAEDPSCPYYSYTQTSGYADSPNWYGTALVDVVGHYTEYYSAGNQQFQTNYTLEFTGGWSISSYHFDNSTCLLTMTII